jgi:putative ABC transport system ATP-binding protein
MDTLVSLENVTKRYDGGAAPAVDGVDLRIDAGEAVAIMGPSGSGKSTLLNLIAGMDKPTSGAIRVGDERIDMLSEAGAARFRRRQVGMIFQFFNLLDDMTVIDNVLLPAQLAGAKAKDARQRAEELIVTLRISHRRDAYPARLSGGERQRVAIARALINRPTLLHALPPRARYRPGSGSGGPAHGFARLILVRRRRVGRSMLPFGMSLFLGLAFRSTARSPQPRVRSAGLALALHRTGASRSASGSGPGAGRSRRARCAELVPDPTLSENEALLRANMSDKFYAEAPTGDNGDIRLRRGQS